MSIYFVEKPKSEKDLQHWKYIKKVRKPNGKWRYYYDHDELVSDIKDKVEDIKDKAGFDERERYKKTDSDAKSLRNIANRLNEEGDKLLEEYESDGKISSDEYIILYAKGTELMAALDAADQYEKKAGQLLEEYKTTPLYKLEPVCHDFNLQK